VCLRPGSTEAGGGEHLKLTLNTMTTIGPSLIITGEITCREDITIHGRVKGQVRMDAGSLVVAPTGNVDANVQGTRVTVHGTVAGDVASAERIELTPTANVTGTLTTPSIVLHDGATFNGVVDMDKSKKARKTPAAA
jgi:cytoskeletal protein CcmA (bactofilin family)